MIEVHHHYHVKGEELISLLHQVIATQEVIMAQLDRLTSEVAETTTVAASAVTLIEGLAQQIRDLEPTQAAIDALADELDATGQALAAAVEANTPASPEPPPDEG